tara:strand:- start:1180 stop:2022 length:843 start_codon:yes stop_codon:yes gene_type:complete
MVTSQEIRVHGGFVQDSIGIGEPVQYWLSASYPKQLQLVFPDSNYNFRFFELVDKKFTTTRVREPGYFDSAVYTLRSFEIDSVQYLNLPAIFINQRDSNLIYAPMDSIYTIHMVAAVSDTVQLIENTAFREVAGNVNYPLIWILVIVLIIIGVTVFLVFGKRIKKYFILKRLSREYRTFSDNLTAAIRKMKDHKDQKEAEHALITWKVFMEKLEKKPYTSLTSKEILGFTETRELKDVLKNIDRSIYGGMVTDDLYKEFQSIEDFTQHRYGIVTESIKNN